jgi:uncharacterized damage-inducible protein DinB
MIQNLKILFRRDLEKLKQEIELYQSEEKIWIIDKGIANSAGNLCLHLIGNLNGFIGANLGNTGYVRQRELEFTLKGVTRHDLVKKIEDTILVVENTLSAVKEEDFLKPLGFPIPFPIPEEQKTLEYLLLHLVTHLSYHLGQVNYHRRLLDIK